MTDQVSEPAAADAPRRPGRPISQKTRRLVLDTAVGLLEERGYVGFVVDEVWRRCGVSKATIYKHWSNGFELAVDAYGAKVTGAVPVLATGNAIKDLEGQVLRLARFYASREGHVVAEILGAGVTQPNGPALLREKFFGQRRSATAELIEAGKRAGQLDVEVDTELMIDMLFGPIVFRLFNGMEPLDEPAAKGLAKLSLRSLVPETRARE